MKLCGLDFETANRHHGSICSVGLAIVENGEVLDKKTCLIKPHKSLDIMSSFHSKIHGITYEDLRTSYEFPEVWENIKAMLFSADCVVIHIESFNLIHLRKVLSLYNLPSISFDYVCNQKLCKYHFPEEYSYSLEYMAKMFGITFQPHDALDDAQTCAKIASQLEIPENFICRFEYLQNL